MIWHNSLPLNISAFLWKVLRHAAPVDSWIKTKDIIMASWCHCCRNHEEESLIHMFLHFKVATTVWNYFGNIMKVPVYCASLPHTIKCWMNVRLQASRIELCELSTTAYIIHELWVARCRARFDRIDMKQKVCLQIISKVQLYSYMVKSCHTSTILQQYALVIMGITRTRLLNKVGKPRNGLYKLNVNGSARREETSGGGIINNHKGDLVAAFSSFYGHGTNNNAEFNALHDGLRLSRVIIESDSTVVVYAIQKENVDHWKLTYIIR